MTSPGSPPRVLSVDAVLKTVVAILLTILSGVTSWLLITVLAHSEKIVKNETLIKIHEDSTKDVLQLLRTISASQTLLLQSQAKFETEINNIKEKLNGK